MAASQIKSLARRPFRFRAYAFTVERRSGICACLLRSPALLGKELRHSIDWDRKSEGAAERLQTTDSPYATPCEPGQLRPAVQLGDPVQDHGGQRLPRNAPEARNHHAHS